MVLDYLKAAGKILTKSAKSYLDRIKQITLKLNIRYKGIRTPKEFWLYLESLSDHSVSRVWYSGHASGNELMLSLTPDSGYEAAAFPKDTIKVSDIKKHKPLIRKFMNTPPAKAGGFRLRLKADHFA